jgi:hypothetical protein
MEKGEGRWSIYLLLSVVAGVPYFSGYYADKSKD